MKIGIAGLPYSGKSTVFNALAFSRESEGGGGGRRTANQRVVLVPDPRLDRLAEIFSPKKYTQATVEYVDLPGFGEGGDAFFASLREVDALILVVRAFADESVPHPDGHVDADRDLEKLKTDLALSDLVPVEKRIEKLEKQLKKANQKDRDQDERELAVLTKCRAPLEAAEQLRGLELEEEERKAIKSFGFLTQKPWLVVRNLGDDAEPPPIDEASLDPTSGIVEIAFRARLEQEICGLDEADRAEFMNELGVTELSGERVIRLSYALLDQISFLTGGDKEVRAWPIRRGTPAVRAAGTIHSDIERGFIRAEIVAYEDFDRLGSFAAARKEGKARLEGKDYVMQDGDVTEFRFNV